MNPLLIQKSHHSPSRANGWSGAPGEADWVVALCDRLNARLSAAGIPVVWSNGDLQAGDNDAIFAARHPELKGQFSAVISPHYDAAVYGDQGGWFHDRAEGDPRAADSDKLGDIFRRRYEGLAGHPQIHLERRNANTSNYHLWRQVGAYPQLLVEHGVGWGADKDWLRANLDAIADVWRDTLVEFLGVPVTVPLVVPVAPAVVDPRYAVLGTSKVRMLRLVAALERENPDAPLEVPFLYETLAPRAGIRAEVAFAQSIHETNWFRFTGTAKIEWHNPAGLGVTGYPGVGNVFPDWETGVRAHLGHLLVYFGPHVPEFCDKDQRHVSHRYLPDDIRQIGGPGRWAPDVNYGAAVLALIEAA